MSLVIKVWNTGCLQKNAIVIKQCSKAQGVLGQCTPIFIKQEVKLMSGICILMH